MKWNLGCGFDIKDGWLNTNHFSHVPVDGAVYLDALEDHQDMHNNFDYILINHTLCVLSYEDAETLLKNAYKCLMVDGTIEVIEMDPVKSFKSYERGDIEAFPGFTGSIDKRFTHHLVGYGRKSLWTPELVIEVLERVGFIKANNYYKSEYDLRSKESLVVKATK